MNFLEKLFSWMVRTDFFVPSAMSGSETKVFLFCVSGCWQCKPIQIFWLCADRHSTAFGGILVMEQKQEKSSLNPIALRKAKIVCNFGLSECNRVN